MPCKMCAERGKTWNGDDPKCAFENGTFNSDNWNCATMNALRERARELGTDFRDDMEAGSIGYVPYADLEGDEYGGYIVLTWYKDRGRTYGAVVLFEDEPPCPLTEERALKALEYSRQFVDKEANL